MKTTLLYTALFALTCSFGANAFKAGGGSGQDIDASSAPSEGSGEQADMNAPMPKDNFGS